MDTQPQERQNQSNLFLSASILIAGVLIAGSVIYSVGAKRGGDVGGEPTLAEETVSAGDLKLNENDVILGDPNAPVTLIEYSDFQCPFCGRFYSQTEDLIKENYIKSGKVKFVYRHFAFLGPESRAAAEAAECAKDQGSFWQYHNELFNYEIKDSRENNGNLDQDLFMDIARNLELDTEEFTACLDSNKYADKVENDYSTAQTLGVRATPTIFVNSNKLEGALPFSNFQTIIDAELAK